MIGVHLEKVTDPAMAEKMREQVFQLDGWLRGAISDPLEAIATCMLWIAHAHDHAGDVRQPVIEDLLQTYLTGMRTRREQWQKSRT